ncbi:hypothetical protein [Kitasatospora sp. NPDC017646]
MAPLATAARLATDAWGRIITAPRRSVADPCVYTVGDAADPVRVGWAP